MSAIVKMNTSEKNLKKYENLCPDCDSTAHRHIGIALTFINNKPVKYVEKYFQCPKCKCRFWSAYMMKINLISAKKAYSEEYCNGDEKNA